MPTYTDVHNPPVSIRFINSDNLAYVFYDEGSHNVTIDQSLITPDDEGTSEFKFQLSDALGNKATYSMNVKIIFLRKFNFNFTENDGDS